PSPYFFFFRRYCHFRNLHSFPTRRSSDLRCRRGDSSVEDTDALVLEEKSVVVRRRDERVQLRWPVHSGDRVSRRCTTSRPSRARDRKSTRLNSSHVAISYAVFCLKKKITD